MTAVSLNEVLPEAYSNGYALPGFVVLGWEDAVAFVEASEETGYPIVIQAGPGCREHTPIAVLAKMFRELADKTETKIVCHLDHTVSEDECKMAINEGFTSVMYDGSSLSLDENINQTLKICKIAKKYSISVEAELGFVGYAGNINSGLTDPDEAKKFIEETQVDALAVSVGNIHLQESQSNTIDKLLLDQIQKKTNCPLVLHGASGIPYKLRKNLAVNSSICKFNIGTELRQEFGRSLRKVLNKKMDEFDRIQILSKVIPPMKEVAKKIILNLRGQGT